MGKSAKAHKRATKKEKLGFSTSSSANSGSAAVRNGQAIKSAANQHFEEDTASRTAIEQRAAKLLLEAEKRDAERRCELYETLDEDDRDADMNIETQAVSLKKLKSTAGAGGMKKKLARRKAQSKGRDANADNAPKRDYVDMFEGRKSR